MIELFLLLFPLLCGIVIYLCKKKTFLIRCILVLAAVVHNAGTFVLALQPDWNVVLFPEYLGIDSVSLVVLGIMSFLFLCAAVHAFFWIPAEHSLEPHHMPYNLFCGVLCAFVFTMTLVTMAQNFGLLWVAVEATTLASAPLINYHRSGGSTEAMWKYLLICSVGIGLALFGTFLLAFAAKSATGHPVDLNFSTFRNTLDMNHEYFKVAFIFCFAGYGLKMGLAPFHTWLPDAHSEAPSMVSVMLSGTLLNCSFLGMMRVQAAAPAALQPFCREYFVIFGILSLAVAAFFIIKQSDYKRMLAYSSVEHMGLLALMWGLSMGNIMFLHMTFHSLCKMMLFLTAGNLLIACGTRNVNAVHGLFPRLKWNSSVWLLGILMICGMPPSPLFLTEFLLIKASGIALGSVILLFLFMVFCGMTYNAVRMTMGNPSASLSAERDRSAEQLACVPVLILVLVTVTGLAMIFSGKLHI